MGWDSTTISLLKTAFSPRPAPRPPTTTTSPVPSPDSRSRTFLTNSRTYTFQPLFPSFLRLSHLIRLVFRSSPCSRFGTLPPTPSVRRRVRAPVSAVKRSIPAKQPFSHLSFPSTMVAFQRLHSTTANALYPLSFCNPSKTQCNGPSHFPHLHRKRRFTNPMKANSIQNGTTKNSLKSSHSPSSPTTHQKPSRPGSMFVPRHSVRYSKPLPLTSPTTSPVSPAFFSKRQSRRSFIPNYPPPPIPTLVRTSSASSSTSSSSEMNHISSPFPTSPKSFHSRGPYTPSSSSRRPPPRSSIPADCGYFETDDQSSVFSLSLYEDDIEMEMHLRGSACSFSSESDDFRFDVEMDLHVEGQGGADDYPPSLPCSPTDSFVEQSIQPTSSHDLSPSPSPTPMLKSKWSSSTIGSIREEHERRGPSAKLRLYFGGGGGKRGSKNSKAPQTPTSISMKSPSRSTCSTKSPRGYGCGHGRHESDVMIIGYGHGHGVRRRGSVTPTVSDAGSDDSALSCASSGLRRKPIPMLLLHGAT